MKKYIIILVLALCCSCKDFLTVPLESSVSTGNYYKTLEDFDLSLNGVYNVLISANWDDDARWGSYFSGFMVLGRIGTDELYAAYNSDDMAMGNYTYTPRHKIVSRTWYMMYKGIQRSNVIINRIASFPDSAEKNRILGEAHFLRSFFYFHLVRLYGEIPLVKEEVSDPSKMDLKKYPIADVYQFITDNLKLSIDLLPEESVKAHPCKLTAKAMLGKVYLQMAGKPLEDKSAASLAEAQLKDVINSGKFSLETNYFELFDGKHEYGSEYIWDIEFTNDGTTTYGGQVGTFDGPSDPDNLYWVEIRAFPEFYDKFNASDKRRDAIARFRFIKDADEKLVPEYYILDPAKPDDVDNYYYSYKFRHALTKEERGSGWANWANPINFPIIRYSDVLLMYAEAGLRANGNASNEQREYVNQVRRRGFAKPINTPNASIDLSTITYDNLLQERSFELCFEGQRWYDLVRFGKLIEAVQSVGIENFTKEFCSGAQNIKEKHNFLPIPQDVIDASNGAIEQNPLWK